MSGSVITEAEYVALLADMREKLARVEYLACPSLHPTRQATALRAQLGMIVPPLESSGGFKRWVTHMLPWLVLVLYCLKRVAALLVVRVVAASMARRTPGSADIVLRSWVVTDVQSALARDFYLGELPEALRREGRTVVRLLRRADRSSQLSINLPILRLGDRQVVPEDAFLPVTAPLHAFWCMALGWARLRAEVHRAAGDGPASIVKHAVLMDLSSIDTAMALEIRIASRAATARLRPRAYVTFYEGYAWEQCAWLGIDEAGVGTTVIGFNHTVICRSNYALRYPTCSARRHRTVPDRIVCAGDAQRELLEASHRGCATLVRTLGSPRVHGTNAPFEIVGDSKPYDVLVLPEGILEECALLFRLAADAADSCSAMRLMVRLHPVLPFDALPLSIRELVNTRPNIALSDGDFVAALRDCRCVLYRGTSAVLQAMVHGLVPIQYRAAGADDVDPLWCDEEARETCSSAAELVEKVQMVSRCDSTWTVDRHRHASMVAHRYAVPFQATSIRELAALGIRD